ncbi:hypothetical protein [Sedimenticola selenatireducens]|uniref:Uncharacterized protein n=1 Tax=Sedimenticola selenatireducens TaxID=191960 RepID=A0A557SJU4_9GAMM|nr:hypothetical protein [Sedimenticola selenatireducens]TVO77707.1 hypothetical protein FHP88_02585 [Sedimenticola selenatireducens]TVT65013.1 MAG: hypothetical protein FHK78_04950 [Sedimenticola selenatireducens]
MKKAALNIHLIVPGLLGPMPALDQLGGELRLPHLERLFAKGHQVKHPGKDLESTLFNLFGISADEKSNLPTAAYRRIGDGGSVDERYWLQLSPVYLRPDQDRLLVFDVEDLGFTEAEASALAELFNAHFTEEGWCIDPLHLHRWYLPLESKPDLKTYELTDVFGRNMDLFLPEGEEGIKWHGVLNEIQMLFYTAEINDRRESEGKGAISGLWISGGGQLAARCATSITALYGRDPLLLGLARATNLSISDSPEEAATLYDLEGEVLVHVDRLQRSVLCADPDRWRNEMVALDDWLAPLIDGIKNGKVDRILLYTCNGRQYQIDRSALRRFWKRSRSIMARLDDNSSVRQHGQRL